MPVIPALGHWGLRVPGQPGIHSKTLSKEKGEGGAGEGAQEVECLPSKHEALSSNHCTTTTTTTKKKKVLLGANGLSTVCLWRCRDRQSHPRWRLQIGTNFLEGNSVNIYQKFKSTGQAKQCRSVIPATQEAEIRRIMIWSQPGQKKKITKKAQGVGSEFKPQNWGGGVYCDIDNMRNELWSNSTHVYHSAVHIFRSLMCSVFNTIILFTSRRQTRKWWVVLYFNDHTAT
jgi:hypothetical protein